MAVNATPDFLDYEMFTQATIPPAGWSCDALCVFILVSSIIIFTLGILGNSLVMWIIGRRTKRTVTSSWYLSLAVSDFLFCTTVPLNCVYMTTGDWHFGHFMCKFLSVAIPLNMYSSVFLLVIISIDRCLSVISPVWSQNHRTLTRSSVIIVLAWIFSVVLSLPTVMFATTQNRGDKTKCFKDYTSAAVSSKTMAVISFVVGLAVPLVVIVICYSVIMQKLRTHRIIKSSKPFKVMTVVIITFAISWLPYHIFRLLEHTHQFYSHSLLKTGIQITIILAYANSFMNPILYSFMGQDFTNKFLKSICTRMDNALHEDAHSTTAMSMSRIGDGQTI
ncbi:hypothetical protein ACEWY4_006929 [Coilia grayii]|uniref:G-protein coupled receptors family 1 profile domain-containing protein n=1 Tax=Coilia grayii TaxID=363190 RepID=A0ABD1KF05_9TELE